MLRQKLADLLPFTDHVSLFADLVPAVSAQLKAQFTAAEVATWRRVVLTGCGDSLFAGMAARMAFEKWTGLPTEALEALEYSRYAARHLGPGTVVFCISNSGGASRTVESVQAARRHGHKAVALTGNAKSPLTEQASFLIHRRVGNIDGVPHGAGRVIKHIAEYQASLLTIYLTVIHLAEVTGRASAAEAEVLRAALAASPAGALATGLAAVAPLAAYIDRIQQLPAPGFFFLGAGPALATAAFGSAKLHECAPANGICRPLEEWAHQEYFLGLHWRSAMHMVIIAPEGPSLSRAVEIAASAVEIGCQVTVMTPAATAGEFPGCQVWPVSGDLPEEFTPLLYSIPLQFFGIGLALASGATAIPLARQDDYKLIRGSQIWTEPS